MRNRLKSLLKLLHVVGLNIVTHSKIPILHFLSGLYKATRGNKLQRTKIHFCYNMMDSFVDVHSSPRLAVRIIFVEFYLLFNTLAQTT